MHEFANPEDRMRAIAERSAENPENTLVISPDNAFRREMNRLIHARAASSGEVSEEEHRETVLMPRQDLTGADRQWAAQYEPGDAIRYTKGSRADRCRSRRVRPCHGRGR